MTMHVCGRILSQNDPQATNASRQMLRAVLRTPCRAVAHAGDRWRSAGASASLSQAFTHALPCRTAQASPPTPRSRHRSAVATPAVSSAQSSVGTDSPAAAAAALESWLAAERSLPAQGASPQSFVEGGQAVLGFAASRFYSGGEVTPSPWTLTPKPLSPKLKIRECCRPQPWAHT